MSVVSSMALVEQIRDSSEDSCNMDEIALRIGDMRNAISQNMKKMSSAEQSDILDLQNRFKRGIYSHSTALFLWGLSEVTALPFHMTFPFGYNLTNAKATGLSCSQSSNGLYELGICNIKLSNGMSFNVYSPEKTLCDIVRGSSEIDIKTIASAYRTYSIWRHKDLDKLEAYAEKLRVSKKIKPYLEILL